MDRKEQLRQFVEMWKTTGPELEKIRRREIREVDLFQCMANLDDVFAAALSQSKPRLSSGLVEQQALFQKLRLCKR